jgi:hypothetical protein
LPALPHAATARNGPKGRSESWPRKTCLKGQRGELTSPNPTPVTDKTPRKMPGQQINAVWIKHYAAVSSPRSVRPLRAAIFTEPDCIAGCTIPPLFARWGRQKWQLTWILPDVWPEAKCARSASEDRDSPMARRAAKHKTSVPLVLCPRSFGAQGRARVTRLRVSVFSGATAPQRAQQVKFVVRWPGWNNYLGK